MDALNHVSNMLSIVTHANNLSSENQHMEHYQEGYQHSFLTLIHGEKKVGDELGIETHPYSPDSARDVSYKEGWNKAIEDYNL